jgi:hypothetical protein
MTNDFPTKKEARGGRHKKRNPYANKLRDKQFRQKIVGGKNGRRGRPHRPETGEDGSGPIGDGLWDNDD